MLSGSKTMLSPFNDIGFLTDNKQIIRVSSFKYLGVILDEKSKWKMHVGASFSVPPSKNKSNSIVYRPCPTATYIMQTFSGETRPGLTTKMKQYVAIIAKSHYKEDF